MTKIVKTPPPNLAAIVKAFGRQAASPGIIYSYGDRIHVPSGKPLPYELLVHEETHLRQQAAAGGPEPWWERYLVDAAFRLEQEIEAYRNQLATITDRKTRRARISAIANLLAGGTYGRVCSSAQVKALLAA